MSNFSCYKSQTLVDFFLKRERGQLRSNYLIHDEERDSFFSLSKKLTKRGSHNKFLPFLYYISYKEDENKRMRLKENLSVRKKEEQLIVRSISGTESLIDVSVKMIF